MSKSTIVVCGLFLVLSASTSMALADCVCRVSQVMSMGSGFCGYYCLSCTTQAPSFDTDTCGQPTGGCPAAGADCPEHCEDIRGAKKSKGKHYGFSNNKLKGKGTPNTKVKPSIAYDPMTTTISNKHIVRFEITQMNFEKRWVKAYVCTVTTRPKKEDGTGEYDEIVFNVGREIETDDEADETATLVEDVPGERVESRWVTDVEGTFLVVLERNKF